MDNLISFFLISALFLVVGATSDASSTIHSYWNEAFPRTPMQFKLSYHPVQLVGATNTRNDALTIKAYWNEVFPTTPMPTAVRSLLPSSTVTSSGLTGRDIRTIEEPPRPHNYRAWGRIWGVVSHDHSISSNWSPDLAPLYFLREDLLSGSRLNVTMTISAVAGHASAGDEPTFWPRQQAQASPFSTSNLTTIFEMFSIEPHSEHASLTRETLADCEKPALKGEVKYCATSLESMVDFVVAEFGSSEIHTVVTSVVNGDQEVKGRKYRVGVGGGRLMSHKVVACHRRMFPYVVFYCHNFAGTRAYMVPLVADDGSRVNAVALCHFDTSNWNPGHASFRLLGVKPGTVPICHFIIEDIAWVPN